MWLNLQIGDVIFPMVGIPAWALQLIVIIGIMGFPVVLILAWAFQITPSGIVLERGNAVEVEGPERRLDSIVNLLLLLTSAALSILLLAQLYSESGSITSTAAEASDVPVITSLTFTAADPEATSRALAARVEQELRHRLISLPDVEVLPKGSQHDPGHARRLALSGSVLLDGNVAHVLAHLIDLTAGRYLMSAAFNLEVGSRLEFETAAAERIAEAVGRSLDTSGPGPNSRGPTATNS